jgi:hypothetical protein
MKYFLAIAFICSSLLAEESNEEIAKKVQNPIADLISLPLQLNTNWGIGAYERNLNVLNIQPVIPIKLSKKFNLITRTIFPLIWAPDFKSDSGTTFGLSDIDMSLFLSPTASGKVMWGIGPAIWFPTSTDDRVGNGEWALGPTFVILSTPDPWVIGVTIRQMWSLESSKLNMMILQYFINYNFSNGTYLTTAPINRANWNASEKKWVVPLGAGVGKVFRIGKLPINMSVQAYSNIVTPENGPDWSTRFQLQFIFPKDMFF